MIRRIFLSFCLLLLYFSTVHAQGNVWGQHQNVIRGQVSVDLEPIYAGLVDEEYPLSITSASRRALEELALFFSAMIYGWSFNYEIGERARGIDEIIELKPEGIIQWGDPALVVTDTEIKNMQLIVWADYHLSEKAEKWTQVWRTGMIRNAQSTGYGPSFLTEYPGWIAIKQIALEDCARDAIRSVLRGSERNRPKQAAGFVSLASFPRYYIDGGRWSVSARFRLQLTEIIPFAVY
jgi:hypothetical protein